jgi:hypothetical protein
VVGEMEPVHGKVRLCKMPRHIWLCSHWVQASWLANIPAKMASIIVDNELY